MTDYYLDDIKDDFVDLKFIIVLMSLCKIDWLKMIIIM